MFTVNHNITDIGVETEAKKEKKISKRRGARPKDISGQQFDLLTALYPTELRDRNGSVIWHCRCECGNEVDKAYEDLKYGRLKSCGCKKRDNMKRIGEENIVRVAGTSVNYLEKAKVRSDNKTGVKGVFYFRDRYIAEINFQKKCYRLGKFHTLEDAVAARRRAEQMIHGEFLDFYNIWKERADANPEWAKANPISVKIEKQENGELKVILKPEL